MKVSLDIQFHGIVYHFGTLDPCRCLSLRLSMGRRGLATAKVVHNSYL